MTDYLKFIAELGSILWSTHQYVEKQKQDPEIEKQLAMEYIRKVSDIKAKREIEQEINNDR